MLRVLGTPTEELWPVSQSHVSHFLSPHITHIQGMSELPDFKKISFPDMPPIPLEEVVPDAPVEVGKTRLCCGYF